MVSFHLAVTHTLISFAVLRFIILQFCVLNEHFSFPPDIFPTFTGTLILCHLQIRKCHSQYHWPSSGYKTKKAANSEKLIPLSTLLKSRTPRTLSDTNCFTNLEMTVNATENQKLKLLKIWETKRCFILQQFPQKVLSMCV